jgi:hypothetical protein
LPGGADLCKDFFRDRRKLRKNDKNKKWAQREKIRKNKDILGQKERISKDLHYFFARFA